MTKRDDSRNRLHPDVEGRLAQLLDLLPTPAPMDAHLRDRLLAIPFDAVSRHSAGSMIVRLRGFFVRPVAIGEAGLLAASLIAGLWWGALGLGVDASSDLSGLVLGHGAGFPEEFGQ